MTIDHCDNTGPEDAEDWQSGRDGQVGHANSSDTSTGRRSLLSSLAAVGTAAALGGVAGGATSKALTTGAFRNQKLTVEVALLGHSWRQGTLSNPENEADFHMPFVIEGWIYSPGTIPGDGFIPTEEGSIGRWFCRGWLIIDELRPEPHTITTQNFYFGTIRADALFPRDHLSTEGLEGTLTQQVPLRSVTGGAGTYMGVCGQVEQRNQGVNTTIFADGTNDPAPNFVMAFDLLLPNI